VLLKYTVTKENQNFNGKEHSLKLDRDPKALRLYETLRKTLRPLRLQQTFVTQYLTLGDNQKQLPLILDIMYIY